MAPPHIDDIKTIFRRLRSVKTNKVSKVDRRYFIHNFLILQLTRLSDLHSNLEKLALIFAVQQSLKLHLILILSRSLYTNSHGLSIK